jgi:hypothetical protein
MEPEIGSVQDLSLAELQTLIAVALKRWENGDLPAAAPAPAPTPLSAALPAEAPPSASTAAVAGAAV